jgi:hypothetical protein
VSRDACIQGAYEQYQQFGYNVRLKAEQKAEAEKKFHQVHDGEDVGVINPGERHDLAFSALSIHPQKPFRFSLEGLIFCLKRVSIEWKISLQSVHKFCDGGSIRWRVMVRLHLIQPLKIHSENKGMVSQKGVCLGRTLAPLP